MGAHWEYQPHERKRDNVSKTYRNGVRKDVIVNGVLIRDAIIQRDRGRTVVIAPNGARFAIQFDEAHAWAKRAAKGAPPK